MNICNKMVRVTANSVTKFNVLVIFVGYISSSHCINDGLISTDMKRVNPLVIKKNAQVPVFLNMKSNGMHVAGDVLHKFATKLSPMTLRLGESTSKLSKSKRFSRSLWPVSKLNLVPNILPLIPKKPMLPLLPLLPLSKPTPILPLLPSAPLAKLSRVVGRSERNTELHGKLLKLKIEGALTPSEFARFKHILLT